MPYDDAICILVSDVVRKAVHFSKSGSCCCSLVERNTLNQETDVYIAIPIERITFGFVKALL